MRVTEARLAKHRGSCLRVRHELRCAESTRTGAKRTHASTEIGSNATFSASRLRGEDRCRHYRFDDTGDGAMALHMLKLAAGVRDLAELKELQKERRKERGVYAFYTRNMPKREEEILDGGSIYWVVKGQIQARQRIKGFSPIVNRRGRPAVLVRFEAKLTRTEWRPHRPFRGWRYLEPKAVPKDLPKGGKAKGLPPKMEAELRELGLL